MAFVHRRRVEFRDTDAAGIVHFSVFFPMMEEAEHAALRHLGLSVWSELDQGQQLTWPRVAASCDYLAAARFEQLLRIEVSAVRIGTTSVTYRFEFFTGDDHAGPGTRIAQGQITAVCCRLGSGQPLRKSPIPDDVRRALQQLMVAQETD